MFIILFHIICIHFCHLFICICIHLFIYLFIFLLLHYDSHHGLSTSEMNKV